MSMGCRMFTESKDISSREGTLQSLKGLHGMDEYHFVLFPWLAFGHMLPFLELAKRFVQLGHTVSFLTTPRNAQRLPLIPTSLQSRLRLVEIPIIYSGGLTHGAEATFDLPIDQVPYLKKAYDELSLQIEDYVRQSMPDAIIFDFVPCWIPGIAAKYSILSVYYSVFSAATLAFLGSPKILMGDSRRTKPEEFAAVPNWFPFTSSIAYQESQAKKVCMRMNIPDISGISSGQRFGGSLAHCDIVAVRSCREFEGEFLRVLDELHGKPVFPLGLLPPPVRLTKNEAGEWGHIFTWLDGHAPRSVLFVGFGSEYQITKNDVREIALGLDISGLPFLWSLRKPVWDTSEELDLLPHGFQARTEERGLVCTGWVPQTEILSHPAVGGCLFHSGWGSIIESLFHGHALVLLPMIADQGLNARMLVDKGLGFEVERGGDGVSFSGDGLAKSIRKAMVDVEGENVRQKSRETATIFSNHELHDNYIKDFLVSLKKMRQVKRGV